MELVTGKAGTPHVSSADDGHRIAGEIGTESYILDTGSRLAVSLVDSNTVRFSRGDMIVQGRHIRLAAPEDVKVASGTQGKKRTDYICVHYKRDVAGSRPTLGPESDHAARAQWEHPPRRRGRDRAHRGRQLRRPDHQESVDENPGCHAAFHRRGYPIQHQSSIPRRRVVRRLQVGHSFRPGEKRSHRLRVMGHDLLPLRAHRTVPPSRRYLCASHNGERCKLDRRNEYQPKRQNQDAKHGQRRECGQPLGCCVMAHIAWSLT